MIHFTIQCRVEGPSFILHLKFRVSQSLAVRWAVHRTLPPGWALSVLLGAAGTLTEPWSQSWKAGTVERESGIIGVHVGEEVCLKAPSPPHTHYVLLSQPIISTPHFTIQDGHLEGVKWNKDSCYLVLA